MKHISRNFTIFIFYVLILSSCFCITVFAEYSLSMLSLEIATAGDINGDGTVDNKDLTRLMKFLAGEDVEIVEISVDTNGDGVVNNKDLTRLLKYIAGEDVDIFTSGSNEDVTDDNIESFVYGYSEMGRELICYSLVNGSYDRTILLNFEIHGFEDDYAHDGQVLVDAANALIEYYERADLNGCRLLIIPSSNPDGLIDGVTNNGFGRCNSQSIDLNRDFDANYKANPAVGRNYTPYAFSAAESRALRDLCLEYSPEIVIDFHGWLNYTIGDSELAEIFYDEMSLSHHVGFTSTNCSGYFANWAHQQGAKALLVEFKNTMFSMEQLKNAVNRLINKQYDNGEGDYAFDEKYEHFTDVQCYTLSSGRVTTYRDFNKPFDTISYIDGSTDLCTINKIYSNGWVKVTYPISSGNKTAYCLLSDFISPQNAVTPYKANVRVNTKVYMRSDLGESIGSVWSTDEFYVVALNGSTAQIIYPIDTGGYKMGWINSENII